jgi:hypothetical protein
MSYPGGIPGPGEIHPWDDPRQVQRPYEGPLNPKVPGINPWEYPNIFEYQTALANHDVMQRRAWEASQRAGVSMSPTSSSGSSIDSDGVYLLLM